MTITGLYVGKITENNLTKPNAAIKIREARSINRKIISSDGEVLYIKKARRIITRREIFEEEEERTKKINTKKRTRRTAAKWH